MFTRNRIMITLAMLATGALLAGCGNGTEQQAEGTESNQADVTFAQDMIPHHEQAVDMAEMVPERSGNQRLLDLAEEVEQAQAPEIEAMTSMLERWDEPAPENGDGQMEHDMAGMMSDEDMAMLGDARGAEFDRMWMEMMIEHHEGAIDMAETQLADGSDPEASELAEDIIETQEAEIDRMRDMLEEL